MIRSQREYKRAMRKMIRRIQSGEEIDSWRESSEDMEILADCILAGYVNGELKDDGKTLRTMDGKIHPIVGGGLGKQQRDLVQKLGIRIATKVPYMSHIEIPILVSETKRNGILYRSCKETALKILSLLDQITSSPEHQSLDTSASSADEIMKFKKLLDDGIITAEEFEAKKRQLLGL